MRKKATEPLAEMPIEAPAEPLAEISEAPTEQPNAATTARWRGPVLYKLAIVTDDGRDMIVNFDYDGLFYSDDPQVNLALERYAAAAKDNPYYMADIRREA